jgi:hypothetical protein
MVKSSYSFVSNASKEHAAPWITSVTEHAVFSATM